MPKMNTYHGRISNGQKWVEVNWDYLLYPQDQAQWGYNGQGPARVAEAVVKNEFGVKVERSLILAFKEDFVAKWPNRLEWTLTSEEIQSWLKGREQ